MPPPVFPRRCQSIGYAFPSAPDRTNKQNALKFPARSTDQWFMPTEPIIIIIDNSFFAWLFCALA
jgi:hypothetical protein